jgi:uncharacterized membrane protein
MLYIYTFLSLILIDGMWLFSMGGNYKKWLGHLFAEKVSFTPVVVFYLLYTFGLVYLILAPAIKNNVSLKGVFVTALVFGLVAYGTYDLTNQSTLKDWPIFVTVIDMLWGALVTGISCVLALTVYKYFR